MQTPARLLATLVLGASAASAQQVINYNFNVSAADVTANFSNPGPTANTVNWFGIGGVGAGSGSGVVNNNGTQPSLVYNTSIATASISSFNTSVFIKTATTAATAAGSTFFAIGFADNLSANLRSEEAVSNQFALRFTTTANNGELLWNTRTATPAGTSVNTNIANTAFTLASSTWYKVDATFTKGAANIWNYSASVSSFGANGTAFDSVVSSVSGAFIAQAGTYDASNLYGAVMWRGGFGPNFASLDNYSIVTTASPVPEPSSFAALAGLGALGLVATRRRARR